MENYNNIELNTYKINVDEYLIRHVSIAITNKCNLGCEYCYKTVRHDKCIKEIPFDKIEKFINDLLKTDIKGNKIKTIQLIGGEPTCHKDFYKICRMIISNKIGLRISTNGTNTKILQSIEMEEIYKDNDVEFRISLDDTEKEDYNRHINTSLVLDNIKHLIRKGANISVKSVITKQNIDNIKNTLLNLYNIGVRNYSYASLYNLGGAKNNEYYRSNYISDLEIYRVLTGIVRKSPELAPMLKSNILFHILINVFIRNPSYHFTKFYLYVHYDGNIYAQDQLVFDEFKLGSIYNSYDMNLIMNDLRKLKITCELKKVDCLKCIAYNYCTKGNYGELYVRDKTLQEKFPTCNDLVDLLNYILNNWEEALEFLKMICTGDSASRVGVPHQNKHLEL